MSQYEGKFGFAERAIEFYRKTKEAGLTKEYEFTSVVGTLLNVFSCVFSERRFDCSGKEVSEILESLLRDSKNIPPHFNGHNVEELRKYFKNIRDGLAHKTKENFGSRKNEQNEIVKIKIASDANSEGIKFSLPDLEKILELLENGIKKFKE